MSNNFTKNVKINDVEVDFSTLKLCIEGSWVNIEARQFNLLKLLLENYGHAVSRNQIMDRLWEDTIVSDNSVSQAITQLRRSLGDDKDTPIFIKTVPRVGYQLVAKVEYQQHLESTPVNFKPENKYRLWLIVISCIAFGVVFTHLLNEWMSPSLEVPKYQYESRLTSVPGPENFLRYSPNGRYLAFSQSSEYRDQMDLAVYDSQTQSIHAVKSTGYSEEAPEWSTDGKWLIYYRQDPISCEIRIMSIVNPIETWRLSPDRHLAYCEEGYNRLKMHWLNDETLYVQQREMGERQLVKYTLAIDELTLFPKVIDTEIIDNVAPIIFDIDKRSHELLYVEKTAQRYILRYLDLATSDKKLLEERGQEYSGLKWHETGYSFWIGNESLRLMSLNGEKEIVHLPMGFVSDLDLNPITKQLAHSEGMVNVNLYTFALNPGNIGRPLQMKQLSSSARTDTLPAVSPDGTQIAFVSYQRRSVDGLKHVELWLKNRDKKAASLLVNIDEGIQPTFLLWSPNGEYLVVGDVNFNLYLINTFSKHMVKIVSDYNYIDDVSWSSDGKFICFSNYQSKLRKYWRYNLKLASIEVNEEPECFVKKSQLLSISEIKKINHSTQNFTDFVNQFLVNALQFDLPVDNLLPSLSLYRPYVFSNGIYYIVREGHRLDLYLFDFRTQLNRLITNIGRHEQDISLRLHISASDDGKQVVLSKVEGLETDILVQKRVEAKN